LELDEDVTVDMGGEGIGIEAVCVYDVGAPPVPVPVSVVAATSDVGGGGRYGSTRYPVPVGTALRGVDALYASVSDDTARRRRHQMKNTPRSASTTTTAITAPTMGPVLDFGFAAAARAGVGVGVVLPVELALSLGVS
jgi:hypothetical protein